ncbi:MAG: hypothetical protein RL651_1575, partial [Pseudomonadota bacterium]
GELEPFLNADRLRHPALGRHGRRLPNAGQNKAPLQPATQDEGIHNG